MKRIKYFSVIALCLGTFSILLAQKSTNPDAAQPANPAVPGSNPRIPGDNPPRVPGTTNPTGPVGSSPSMPGSTIAPGVTPIGTPSGSATPGRKSQRKSFPLRSLRTIGILEGTVLGPW